MPTHSLLSFMESPDTVTQDILIGHSAKMPDPVSSMTPHGPCLERAIVTAVDQLICCMFCEKTFDHQDDLGPHVLEQHPTTFPEPAVLRVEAEFRIPGERNLPKPIITVEREHVHSCIVCKQVFQDAPELENHMRKHKDYFYYCCNVCGRRFREPWFLKAHMKMHTKSGKSKAAQEFDAPITINGITQEISEPPVTTIYKMCMVCGFFFPDHDSLASHSKIHNREADFHDRDGENLKVKEEERPKQTFIQGLNLQPSGEKATLLPVRTSRWIAQLDPFNTYQAWQLATKGKIAVGPNNIKDIGQEASTDNEENTSDREELNGVSTEGPAAASKDVRPPAPAITGPTQRPRRSLIQKDKNKERPTTCEDCQKTFRTYHQLVLHSRIHKRDRPGGESPTAGLELKPSPGGAVEPEEEEGLITEEGPLTDILASAEEGFERTKGRSKECTYCGKSFRSSYYLTVHLRTHTGEKPYKCAYCDYAAAQKTSLKYHLDRRHKEKPYMELPIRPSSASSASLPSPPDLKMEQDSENSSSPTKMWIQDSKPYPTETKCIPSVLVTDSKPLNYREFVKCAAELTMPVNLKMEKQEIKDENYDDTPLNLSLKVSLSISAAPRKVSIPIACQQCPYKTIYPEVLAIHKKMAHKEKCDHVRRSAVSLQKRHTGCPPALDGKDVTPLPILVRSHPRRTKSPTPVPGKTQEKKMAKQSQNESQKCRQNVELQGNGQDGRFTEVMRKPSSGGVKYLLDIPDRVGTAERSYPVRTSVIWKTDAPHMCLSSRFGKLPHLDLGEPSNKRTKYNGAREGDAAEMAMGFRSAGEMPNLSLMSGRASLPGSSIQDALGVVSSSSAALGGALDSEWGNMNLLRSCTLNDLASLYHTSPGNPPRIGGRTVLYQHLPTLPNLPRIESSSQFPYQRYGNADKSS